MKKSRHELREERRELRKQERLQQEEGQRKTSQRNRILGIGLAVLLVIGIGYAVTGALTAGGDPADRDYLQEQLVDIPAGFVHWHADVDVFVCGQERRLPEALPGGLIGDHQLHTHDATTNRQSFAGSSDGNGVVHNEGDITLAPHLHTLGQFLENLNIPFSSDGVYEYRNGGSCAAGAIGQLTVTVNEKILENPKDYIPRDGDKIEVRFE